MNNLLDLFTQDLTTFSHENLLLMSKFYHLDTCTNHYTLAKNLARKILSKNRINVANMNNSLLEAVNDQQLKLVPLADYARFFNGIWPMPNSEYSEEDKYFIQLYVKLSNQQIARFNDLLSMNQDDWDYKQLISSITNNVINHTQILHEHSRLSELAAIHTESPLKISSSEGQEFNDLLNDLEIPSKIIVFRTINKEYTPILKIGQQLTTENIWSTSYDPMASLGFGISDPNIDFVWLLRITLPDNFIGGLFVENNTTAVIKEQAEVILAAGIQLTVKNIVNNMPVTIFDNADNKRTFSIKLYDLISN